MKRLLDGMKWTPAAATDIRRTFEKFDPNWNKPPRKRRQKPANVVQLRKAK